MTAQPPAITLKQIALEAGVSAQTVSNVLLGRYQERWPSVAQRAQRIREIAARLDYRPNAAAKSMRSKRSRQVGVLILNHPPDRFLNLVSFETILGVSDRMEAEDYVVSLVRVGDVRNGTNHSRVFREQILDGLIVFSAVPSDVQEMVESSIPSCVWVDNNVWRPKACIRRDERHAGRLAATALADLGYKRLLWFGRELAQDTYATSHYSFKERLAGVTQVAQQRGLKLDLLHCTPNQIDRQPELLSKWLKPEIGMITYATPLARWLSHIVASMGVRPGYDFGMVCCDSSHDLQLRWPGLSRVTFDRYGMGIAAADMMLALLQNKPCKSYKIQGHWQPGNTAWGPRSFSPLPITASSK